MQNKMWAISKLSIKPQSSASFWVEFPNRIVTSSSQAQILIYLNMSQNFQIGWNNWNNQGGCEAVQNIECDQQEVLGVGDS